MSILSKVTWKAMWQNKVRTVVTIIGVVLSAALFVSITTIGVSFWDYLIRGVTYMKGDCYLEYEAATDEDLISLQSDKRVSQIADLQVLGHTGGYQIAAVNQVFLDTMPVHLIEGRMPQSSSEILLNDRYVQRLEEAGEAVSVGDTITLPVRTLYPDYDYRYEIAYTLESKEWEQTYTVTGIYEYHFFGIQHLSFLRLLTLADGDQGEALWHHLFVKTTPASAAYDLATLDENGNPLYGECCDLNIELLNYYGASQYQNINIMIVLAVAVLLIIIMLASVSLISNSFFISLSERTKQFGLLSGIGATKKQIRKSLFFEAAVVCAFGIPVGMFIGYFGIAAVIEVLRADINAIFSVGTVRAVHLEVIPSVFGFCSAAVICALTVLLSAWVPAKRAAAVSPLEAIKQQQDYKTGSKIVRVNALTQKVFGIPGVLTVKYFKVSKKKYKTTVRALAFSMVLFVAATFFTSSLSNAVENVSGQEEYDFLVRADDMDLLSEIREVDGIAKSAFVSSTDSRYKAILPNSALREEHKQLITEHDSNLSEDDAYFLPSFRLYYLEDSKLEEFLIGQQIDPAPYLNGDNPTALVISGTGTLTQSTENGASEMHTYRYKPLTDEVKELSLYVLLSYPSGLTDEFSSYEYEYIVLNDGSLAITIVSYAPTGDGIMGFDESTRRYYKIQITSEENGTSTFDFYEYDVQTDTMGELAASSKHSPKHISIGETVGEIPFGVSRQAEYGVVTLLLPLSAASENDLNHVSLAIKSEDYSAVKAALDSVERIHFGYTDYAESQRDVRGLVFLVSVFSICFIILITLISAANVFNTISTNIALRRRDLGMLKSMGLTKRQMICMMIYECLLYGTKAILWGLPFSIALSYGCSLIVNSVFTSAYRIPVDLILISIAGIFAVVFMSMIYSVCKLRKDNPIDAIRMENI